MSRDVAVSVYRGGAGSQTIIATRGWRMEGGGWKIEEGGSRIEDGEWRMEE
jgi:hypothetical protein